MAENELKNRVEAALEIAKKSGAQGAWAVASKVREVEFTGRAGSLEKVKESTAKNLSISLYVDGRFSKHKTTSLAPDRVESFIQEAVALTRALQPDDFRQLPDPALFQGRSSKDLKLLDPALASVKAADREKVALTIESTGRKDQSVIDAQGHCSDAHAQGYAASSNGFAGAWEGCSIWYGTRISVQGEGDKKPSSGVWYGACAMDKLPSPESIAKEAIQRVKLRLGAKKAPSQNTTMVVDPRAGAKLIFSLLRPATGKALALGRSFFAEKQDKKVASKLLTLVDDPLIVGGLASRHFDKEGIAARPLPILENGVFRNAYIDTYYGKKLGVKPTTGTRSNLVLRPSVDKGLEEICREIGEGIYVNSWLGGNSDSTSGAFSFGVEGHMVRNGKIAEPISEMNVTGNLLDLFSSLSMVGNDPWPFRSLLSGTMVFENVQFSGT